MSDLYINLFGKLKIQHSDQRLIGLDARRAQELFCYLFLYRDRQHEREKLASLMWGDNSTERAKKYLRQTLWQLQSVFDLPCLPEKILLVGNSWISVNPQTSFWLDVAVFDHAFACVEKIPSSALDPQQIQLMQAAVELYQGGLLEGWYVDWCIYERERYQEKYLTMLDKLLTYSEAQHDYALGLSCGAQILRYDRARESTHRRLMRLHYLNGDRTAALHQYESCVAALAEELDVPPAKSTVTLYEQIRQDRIALPSALIVEAQAKAEPASDLSALPLQQLQQIQTTLSQLQNQVTQLIQSMSQNQPDCP